MGKRSLVERVADGKRWPIGEEDRRELVEAVKRLATTAMEPSDQLAAIRVLLAMDEQNQRDEKQRRNVVVVSELDAMLSEMQERQRLIELA